VEQHVTEPTGEDIEQLARQLLIVRALANAHLGRQLCDDDTDLDTLQALLDVGALEPHQTYELQSLGVVFGRRLAEALGGVDWVIVEDEYGRDPALRYLKTSLLFFPLTMISKRIEAGQRVFVRDLFRGICAEINKLRGELGPR
jgi:hypothetical protein